MTTVFEQYYELSKQEEAKMESKDFSMTPPKIQGLREFLGVGNNWPSW